MDMPAPQTESADHHALAVDASLNALSTTAKGLSATVAEERLSTHGPNRLPEPPRRGPLVRFLLQFHNILIYVLLGAAVVTALLDHVIDTLVILAVVVANAAIGFIQEGKAEKAMDAIRKMLAPRASVLRDGVRTTVRGEDLVPGDVVLIEAGDKTPADLRLIEGQGLRVQEAILTGESAPVEKGVAPVVADAPLGDRTSMAFSGTLVAAGQGRGVVTATGAGTEIGRISGLLTEVEKLTTPLVKQMDAFAKWLSIFILTIGAAILAFGVFVGGQPFEDMFLAVVGLSVAAIPEGLPAVLTITLAVGVQAMARRNAIVRRLPAIETLGSVSVICSDKTGTLTRNEMTVADVQLAGAAYAVEGVGYGPEGQILQAGAAAGAANDSRLSEIARAAALCNDAELHHRNGEWVVEGDPMEGALAAFAHKAGLDVTAERAARPRTDAIPFDSKHRFMAVLSHDHEGRASAFVKGAPERLLDMCDRQRDPSGQAVAIDLAFWRDAVERIANQGRRVIALAVKPHPEDRTVVDFEDVESGMILIGMVGLIDPPRPEAIEAVAECGQAGIRVKMITGDHAGTAAEIGRQIGLAQSDRVLTGAEIETMDEAELAAVVEEVDVFARTTPEHKLRLVMALQSRGLTVAMTGDGVNDAPALKRADAGVAMGLKGSEAAKEAAELVLADDNFASIAAAVREGRTVYDNIRKVISWTLPTNAGEAMVIVVALLAGMTLPITPVQILWINMITAVTLGIALAFEPTEPSTMRRPPRRRDEPLLTGDLVWRVIIVAILFLLGVFGVFLYAYAHDHTIEEARTMAVNTMVVLEIFNLFVIRNIHGTSFTWRAVRGTRVIWITIGLVTAAQFAITYIPPIQPIFDTAALSLTDGLIVIGVGVAFLVIMEAGKQMLLAVRALNRRSQTFDVRGAVR